jgi:hypothetical protein
MIPVTHGSFRLFDAISKMVRSVVRAERTCGIRCLLPTEAVR